jgi:hypothetical protein
MKRAAVAGRQLGSPANRRNVLLIAWNCCEPESSGTNCRVLELQELLQLRLILCRQAQQAGHLHGAAAMRHNGLLSLVTKVAPWPCAG